MRTKTLVTLHHPLRNRAAFQSCHHWTARTAQFCATSWKRHQWAVFVSAVSITGGSDYFLLFRVAFSHKFLVSFGQRRTGVMRPTQGPNNMGVGTNRPRSKTNKLYYYQGYHDGSSKFKKKPPKGMYINHDDVMKLAAQDLNANETPRKQPMVRNDLLAEPEREIGVLYSQVRFSRLLTSSNPH